MATSKQKQELINTLKFTPINVRISLQGYGGESYAGRVDRKIYDYFARQRIDLDEYAGDWDGQFEEHVPNDMRPFAPGTPYDCDDLWHASGAELSDLNTIAVEPADGGDTIWQHNMSYSDLEESGVVVGEMGGCELDDLESDQVVYWGGQGEKGCFFDAELTLTAPFDPRKLRIGYENCDNWYIVNYVEYDGEELDGSGGYSTTGKWGENKWILPPGEEVYDSVCLDDREDEGLEWAHETGTDNPIDFPESACTSEEWDPAAELEKIQVPVLEGEEMWAQQAIDDSIKTQWFDSTIKPVHKGEYECEFEVATWPWPSVRMCEWTGRTWKDHGDKIKGEFKWRGLTENLG